jgi:hypothetical protein
VLTWYLVPSQEVPDRNIGVPRSGTHAHESKYRYVDYRTLQPVSTKCYIYCTFHTTEAPKCTRVIVISATSSQELALGSYISTDWRNWPLNPPRTYSRPFMATKHDEDLKRIRRNYLKQKKQGCRHGGCGAQED